MKMNTAKSFLLFLLALLLILSLTVFSAHAIRNTGKEDPAQGNITVQLGSGWTTILEGTLTQTTDLAVNNSASSFYDVEVRILSGADAGISENRQIIPSGCWVTFSAVPTGKYLIQARSADGIVREYTLKLAD